MPASHLLVVGVSQAKMAYIDAVAVKNYKLASRQLRGGSFLVALRVSLFFVYSG